MVADADDRSSVRHRVPNVAPVGETRARFGEGPVWDVSSGCVRWVDIPAGDIHATDPSTGATSSVRLTPPVSAVFPTDDGRLAVATGLALVALDRDGGGATTVVRFPGGPDERLNDGACDRNGRLWMGTIPVPATGARTGALWRVDDGGVPRTAVDGLGLANGLAWSPDGITCYLVDTRARRIDAYEVSASDLVNRRLFVDLGDVPGVPDGLTVDAHGDVWVAMAGGGSLRCHAPDGSLQVVLDLPVRHPTSCCFGGADLDQLFVTTGTVDPTVERPHPWDGRLLRVDAEVVGLPPVPLRLPC